MRNVSEYMKTAVQMIIAGILRTALYAFGAVCVLAVAALVSVETPWFKDHARVLLEKEVNRNINGELRVGKISGNLLTGITLEDVQVAGRGSEVFALKSVKLRYRLLPLIYRRISLRSIELGAPRFMLERDSEGRWNAASLFTKNRAGENKKAPALPWTVDVRALKIERGTVSIARGSAAGRATIENIRMNLAVRIVAGKRTKARLIVREFAARYREKGVSLEHLSAEAYWDGEKGILRSFEARAGGSSVTGKGAYQPAGSRELDAFMKFSINADELAALTGRAFSGGTINGVVSAKGNTGAITFEQEAAWKDMSVRSRGVLDAETPALALNMRARNISMARLSGKSLEKNKDVLNIDADVSVRGKELAAMDAKVSAAFSNSRFRGRAISRARINGTLHKGIVASSVSIAMTAGDAAVNASGTAAGLWDSRYPVDLVMSGKISAIDLAALTGGAPASNLNAAIEGRLNREPGKEKPFVMESVVAVGSSTVAGIGLYPSRVECGYSEPVFSVRTAVIDSELGKTVLEGQADEQGNVSGRYSIRIDALERLNKLVKNTPLGGSTEINGTVGGSIRHPSVTVNMKGVGITISSVTSETVSFTGTMNDVKGFEQGPAEISFRALGIATGKIKIDTVEFQARRETSTVEISAEALLEESRGMTLSGSVTLDGRKLKEARLADLSVYRDTVSWRSDGPSRFRSVAGGWELDPVSIFSWGGQRITAFGATRGEAVDYTVRIDSVNLSGIGAVGGIRIPLEGLLRGGITLSGTVSAPIVAGRLLLENGQKAIFPFDSLSAAVSYSDGLALMRLALENGGETLLSADGDIPVRLSLSPFRITTLSSEMDMRLTTALLSASLFAPFFRGIEKAEGDIRAGLAVSGDPSDPSVSGQLTVDNGALRLASTGVEYSGITARVSIADDTVTLNRVSLRGGDGAAELQGKAVMAGMGLERFDISLKCRSFKLMETASMSGTVDTDLRWQGSLEDHDITGSAALLKGHYRIPETVKSKVEEVEIVEAPGGGAVSVKRTEGEGQTVYGGMNMDAKLRVPGNFWIRGRGVNAELKGDLDFRKSLDSDIRMAGTIRTVRGTYVFRQRTLNIVEGTVTFSGGSRIDPFLNIRADGKVRDVSITIALGGTLSRPEIALRSTPSMEESDILSYLVFGRPAGKLTQSEGSVLQNTTANVVSDMAVKGLRDVLGSELTPDVIEVDPEGEGGVGVGKYVNDRLFIKYEWNIGPENLSQTSVEYEINRFFNLRSQAGNEKTAGLDLLWKYDY